MLKKLVFMVIFLAFAIGMTAPSGAAVASGANHIYFPVDEGSSICNFPTPTDPRCNLGEVTVLPNGKKFLKGYVDVVIFSAGDPRWNVECIFSGDPFPPGNPNAYPIMGSFVCTPLNPALAGGWWEGTAQHVLQPGRYIATWQAKGYGTFDRLISRSFNSVSNHTEGEIIELPGYQP